MPRIKLRCDHGDASVQASVVATVASVPLAHSCRGRCARWFAGIRAADFERIRWAHPSRRSRAPVPSHPSGRVSAREPAPKKSFLLARAHLTPRLRPQRACAHAPDPGYMFSLAGYAAEQAKSWSDERVKSATLREPINSPLLACPLSPVHDCWLC